MTAATIGTFNKASTTVRMVTVSHQTPWATNRLLLLPWCLWPSVSSGAVHYLRRFRTNSQITNHPSGMPNPWSPTTTRRSSKVIFSGRNEEFTIVVSP